MHGSTQNVLFCSGIALLLTHELDAVSNREWRVMPILGDLAEGVAEHTFVALHVPLFVVLIATTTSLNLRLRSTARSVASGFLILHAALHFSFSRHSAYAFDSTFSDSLIYGAAACGLLYLVIGPLERPIQR